MVNNKVMIKKGNAEKRKMDSAIRAQLIRKGNEFFADGRIEEAKKIFVTTDYKDGLIRLGDYFWENDDLYSAIGMYFKSENSSKIDAFCKRSAKIIKKLLNDDKKYEKIIINKGENEIK